jgi:hypothetical protein
MKQRGMIRFGGPFMLPSHRAALLALVAAAGGCSDLVGLEDFVVADGARAGGGGTAQGGGAGGDAATTVASGGAAAGGSADGGSGGAGGTSGAGGAGGSPPPPVTESCNALLAAAPGTQDGIYAVDPDGSGGSDPFDVVCDMSTAGGGWTLVAQEAESEAGTLRFLGIEVNAPQDLTAGASALIGLRFQGLYTQVRVVWAAGARSLAFEPSAELFDNSEELAMSVSAFVTNDPQLSGWVMGAGGAIFCRAAVSPAIRPGDTSWAIKPSNDNNTVRGCNSMGWLGRGAFYSGSPSCTSCDCHTGGFVGTKDDSEAKSATEPWVTQIFVR